MWEARSSKVTPCVSDVCSPLSPHPRGSQLLTTPHASTAAYRPAAAAASCSSHRPSLKGGTGSLARSHLGRRARAPGTRPSTPPPASSAWPPCGAGILPWWLCQGAGPNIAVRGSCRPSPRSPESQSKPSHASDARRFAPPPRSTVRAQSSDRWARGTASRRVGTAPATPSPIGKTARDHLATPRVQGRPRLPPFRRPARGPTGLPPPAAAAKSPPCAHLWKGSSIWPLMHSKASPSSAHLLQGPLMQIWPLRWRASCPCSVCSDAMSLIRCS